MKKTFLISLVLILAINSCSKKITSTTYKTQKENIISLDLMLIDLHKTANSKTCTNYADWKFIAIGVKSCGGPQDYLAYSSKINTANFLKNVEEYTEAEKAYNNHWGIISDCLMVTEPKSVFCKNGKAVLVY